MGVPKPNSAVRHLSGLNSSVQFERFGHVTRQWLDEHGREWDLIVECTDNFDAKYLVADYCADSGVPLVWGTVVRMAYQVSVFCSRAVPDAAESAPGAACPGNDSGLDSGGCFGAGRRSGGHRHGDRGYQDAGGLR